MFIGGTDAKAEAPILWPPDAKSQLIGKDPDAGKDEGRRRRGKPRTRWLDGITDSMDMSPLRSSVYSCYLFLTSSASVRSILFLSFIVPIFGWNAPFYLSNFLEDISLIFLKISLVFPNLFSSYISLHCSLRKAFSSLLAILWYSAFRWVYLSFYLLLLLLFFSQLFVRPPQTTILHFQISFSWGWFWSLPSVQYYKPPSIILQALCQI